MRSEPGAPVELSGVMLDVTAELEAHRALQQSEENYRRMVHFSPDAIASTGTAAISTSIRASPGDQQHLEQVLTNLTVNAVHAMPDGGLVVLELTELELTEDVEPWRHTLGLPSSGHFARLTLRGTGLGLAIAKRLVEAQGGAITAESTEGVGTAFHLFLPMAR